MDAVSFNSLTEVQFGAWCLSPKKQFITDGEVKQELKPLTYNLLVYFLQNHDRIVTRQELMDYVWRQAFVDDNAINRALSELRKALKSDRQKGMVIKTHYRKGFSVCVDVNFVKEAAVGSLPELSAKSDEKAPLAIPSPNHPIEDINSKGTGQAAAKPQRRVNVKHNKIFALAIVILITVILSIVSQNHWQESHEPATPLEGELLSWDNGVVFIPLASLDGNNLAYTLIERGTTIGKLVVKSMVTKQSIDVYVPTIKFDEAFAVAWSQNSELYFQVVNYREEIKCEIWKVKIEPEDFLSSEKVMAQKQFDCKSKNIMNGAVLAQDSSLIYSKHYYRSKTSLARLVSRELDTGEEFQVSTPDMDGYGDWTVRISHDDKKMAYIRIRYANSEIYIANVDGSDAKKVADLNGYIPTLSWAPNDEAIYWVDVGTTKLSKYHLATGEVEQVALTTEKYHNRAYTVDLFDDKYLVAATLPEEQQIRRIDVTTGKVLPFANLPKDELLATPLGQAGSYLFVHDRLKPSLWRYANNVSTKLGLLDGIDFNSSVRIVASPDGQQLLVANKKELHFYSITPLVRQSTVKIKEDIRDVDWLRGNKLLLTTLDRDNVFKLWLYDLASDDMRLLPIENVAAQARGDLVYYVDGSNRFYQYNLESGDTRFLHQFASEDGFSWALVGNYLVRLKPDFSGLTRHPLDNLDVSEPLLGLLDNEKEGEGYLIAPLRRSGNTNALFIEYQKFQNVYLYRYDLSPLMEKFAD